MSDVLLQNAFKNLTAAQAAFRSTSTGLGTTAAGYAASGTKIAGTCCTCGAITGGANDGRTFYQRWSAIPMLTNPTSGFKVCDATGYYRCGVTCTWTVPAGVCCVQFQIWGPGGGTGTNCCCGGAPFGPTGAYASVIIQTTPGCVYTLVSGCAYCCWATQTTPGLCGTPSYVTGYNLSGFCANSGCSNLCQWRVDVGRTNGSCMFPTGNSCGPTSCSGWNFCWDSGDDQGEIYYAFSSLATFAGTATNSTVYGINGMWPYMAICSGAMCGITRPAPVFGFCGDAYQPTWCWNGNTCAGCCFNPAIGQACLTYPGQGGYASSVYAGCNACGGDSGRMGMVCVSYICS